MRWTRHGEEGLLPLLLPLQLLLLRVGPLFWWGCVKRLSHGPVTR